MTIEQAAQRLIDLGYTETARVGSKFKVGRVVYIGNDRYLEFSEVKQIIRKLEK